MPMLRLFMVHGCIRVVLITTKKAKAGPATLNVNIYSGVTLMGHSPQLLNTQQLFNVAQRGVEKMTDLHPDLMILI